MIWKNILIFFGIKEQPTEGQANAIRFSTEYNDKTGINLTYIAATKIANITVTESNINVSHATQETNARAEFLQTCADKVWRYKKRIVSRAAGKGKVCLFPYVGADGKIKYDIVPQSNIIVLTLDGESPIDIAVLCDRKKVNGSSYGKFKRYQLLDHTHIITEFYGSLSGGMVLGDTPPDGTGWEALPPLVIQNVDRLLFGGIDCPVDTRDNDKFYAVKITDGCDDIIRDIREQFDYLANEYRLKKAFIGADEALFHRDKDGKYVLPDTQIFKILDTGIENFFEVFDPAIRADAIFLRLKNTFELLENHIGLSRGIFTSPENVGSYNNESNIKRSVFDTHAFVAAFRDNIQAGINDYLYACNVLCEHFGLTPHGVKFDEINIEIIWSNALIQDTAEEFNQYIQGVSQGIIGKDEVRQWITGEDIETAQKKIAEIKTTDPNLKDLIGNAE